MGTKAAAQQHKHTHIYLHVASKDKHNLHIISFHLMLNHSSWCAFPSVLFVLLLLCCSSALLLRSSHCHPYSTSTVAAVWTHGDGRLVNLQSFFVLVVFVLVVVVVVVHFHSLFRLFSRFSISHDLVFSLLCLARVRSVATH